VIQLVKELCQLFGPSGCEDEVRQYIHEIVSNYADSCHTDANGNLIVFKKGAKNPCKAVLLAAHMDEVGLIIRGITDSGYLKFSFVGGVDSRVVIGRKVIIGDNRIPGVIGVKAYHLVDKSEEKKAIPADKLYIDIGAADKDEAKALVSLGDYGCFCSEPFMMGDDMFKAKAIDDRVGCAALIKLIEKPLPFDTWFAFTVQEEIGTRGALGAAFSVKPDIAIIAEGTTAADLPSMPDHKKVCAPGKGVVIPFMDGGTVYDRELFELLRQQPKKTISPGKQSSIFQVELMLPLYSVQHPAARSAE